MLRVFARTTISAAALLFAGTFASAADLDGSYLRGDIGADGGSVWDGTYVGASLSYSIYDGNAAGSSKQDVKDHLRGTSTLIDLKAADFVEGFSARDEELAYGGVIGHNWSWDGVIFGVEASYQRTNLHIEGDESTRHIYQGTGTTSSDVYKNFQARYGGSVDITDIATVKGRIGYDAGPLMPFLGAGVAVIRGDSSHYTAIGSGDTTGGPAVTVPTTPQYNETLTGIFGLGMVGSVGVDYMLTDGLFLRGEYEMIRIGSFDGSVQDFQNFKTTVAAKF